MTKKVILIFILLLAAFFRLWDLGNVPPSASLDEASIGYNAYSLSKTGKDEYGQLPILSHRAYDDWRRATYLYLVVPTVRLFGLHVVAVRLPAVILSILTVLVTYFLVKELFKQKSLALLSALLLAISPWHMYISRIGHESNAYLSFFIFGVFFFLHGERKRKWSLLLISMIFFILSMIGYYSGQIFIPLFVLGICFIFRKTLLSMIAANKKILIAVPIVVVVLLFLFKGIFSPEAIIRYQGTTIFREEAHWQESQKRMERWSNAIKNNDIFGKLLNSQYVFNGQLFLNGYFVHFKPEWLFLNSSLEPHKIPNMGLLYLWEAPFIIVGIITFLFSNKIDKRIKLFVFLWFFLSSLSASIATGSPHAMRSYTFLPMWQLFTAFGLFFVFDKLVKLKIIPIFAFMFLILYSLSNLFNNYFIVFPKTQSSSFQYALSLVIPYVLSEDKNYKKVIFSNRDNLYQSYMLFLYHSRFDPLVYQKLGGTKSGGYEEHHKFGKYEFRPIHWEQEKESGMYVGNIDDFPLGTKYIKQFANKDGKTAIGIVIR